MSKNRSICIRETCTKVGDRKGRLCMGHYFENIPSGKELYTTWQLMNNRCYNKKNLGYRRYGGRGIKVCERWRHSFKNFYDDVAPRPANMSLDRTDNNGDYTPENCRWATPFEQMNNQEKTIMIFYNGKFQSLGDYPLTTSKLFITLVLYY